MLPKRKPSQLSVLTVRYLILALILLALVLPFIAFLVNAFAERWFFPQFIPQEWSVEEWVRVFSGRGDVLEALWNSTVIAVGVTALSVLIGLPAARALGLYEFRGKKIVEFLILAPIMIPPLTVGMGLSINFLRAGLGGTMIGVALAHLVPVMPYVVFTLSGVFANYDVRYEEQARTLGANPLRVFWHITLPAIFPGLVVASLFAFLTSWSQYVLTFLIGGGRVITAPVLLFSSAAGGNRANLAVQSLLFIFPALLILLLTARYLSGKNNAIGGIGRV
ncbi:MAG: ABC transporter permease [Chloroflexota bacterium]